MSNSSSLSAPMLSEKETEYLRSQHLARIATSSLDGMPDVAPVGFDFDGSYFYIGGMNITETTKCKNILKNNNVALVIDDLMTTIDPWDPHGIRSYGTTDIVERDQLSEVWLRDNDHFKVIYIRTRPGKSGVGERLFPTRKGLINMVLQKRLSQTITTKAAVVVIGHNAGIQSGSYFR